MSKWRSGGEQCYHSPGCCDFMIRALYDTGDGMVVSSKKESLATPQVFSMLCSHKMSLKASKSGGALPNMIYCMAALRPGNDRFGGRYLS